MTLNTNIIHSLHINKNSFTFHHKKQQQSNKKCCQLISTQKRFSCFCEIDENRSTNLRENDIPVGFGVGPSVGCLVGVVDGNPVGVVVGVSEGWFVGGVFGLPLGCVVGDNVGIDAPSQLTVVPFVICAFIHVSCVPILPTAVKNTSTTQ